MSGLAIARTLNRTVYFSRDFRQLLRLFPGTQRHLRVAPAALDAGHVPLPNFREGGYGRYEPRTFEALPRDVNAVLCCYFQSYKYFAGMEDEVREMLQPRDTYVAQAHTYLRDVAKQRGRIGPLTFVGVHVRRGDMSTPEAFRSGRLGAQRRYLSNAMTSFRDRYANAHFLVCSDDITWCEKNIPPSQDVTFVTSHTSSDAYSDFTLLSQCNHSIMTVGTFGWWAAWLAGGTTVYYRHQNRPASVFGRQLVNEDFFPPTWIPMENAPEPQH